MSQPIIQYTTTQQYSLVWADHGSGAFADGAFWRPQLGSGQRFLGDYAQNGYASPWQSMTIIDNVLNDDPNNPALAAPASFNFLWAYATSIDFPNGTANFNVVWTLVPPNNYLACGSVVTQTGQIPFQNPIPQPAPIPGLACVRQDLVATRSGANLAWIWNDRGSGNSNDVGVWLVPRLNNMLAVPNYDQPASYYSPNNAPQLAHMFGVPSVSV